MTSVDKNPVRPLRVAVIGGGAAGYFGAIACAEQHNSVEMTVFEGTRQPLYKVGISGGGRCNVTHHCFEPEALAEGYPRGSRELLGAFKHFQPRDTVAWFVRRGVKLKTEEDGRMFPVTDLSATIIDCLQKSAAKAGVAVRTGARVVAVRRVDDAASSQLELELKGGERMRFDQVLLTTGSSPQGYKFAEMLGHKIVPCVPSLFTFSIKNPRLTQLSGLSFPAVRLTLLTKGIKRLEQTGPVLITHWGLSGPAVLKLSAFGARQLYASRYQADLLVNWISDHDIDSVLAEFHAHREQHPRRAVVTGCLLPLPRRFWERIVSLAGVDKNVTWSHCTRAAMKQIATELTGGRYRIVGKGEFKEEFVTCGGVDLREVDFGTMESRICAGLFFAGEILNIDGITGGYNFQSAWTTGWLAGRSMGTASVRKSCDSSVQ
jgi:predicted Rossmann fold flavoprotein